MPLILDQLLEPVNGFIILDLHNLWCQIHNFEIPYEEIVALYPLHCVRDIQISGGSWEQSDVTPDRIIWRDTHDDAVPQEVFRLLALTMGRCAGTTNIFTSSSPAARRTGGRRNIVPAAKGTFIHP
ncbi:DUF692 family multinuclear iron-containing protein [Paraflavitalea sp. CAU 1676]|uniref:multinuclear nonheme iron-dependent oxidase n=1 Tax=Paraflavitalea sp. CAU 1676 TaxID=3032598 RepID=UPI0023DCB795|nr:DUF692 family multinuclear iron-containing protein [Paraflavitalea sp. CAU 1676]MDF2190157.1 DUF692 family protein [Paraflavitalea sp. CAU 1676]